MIYCVLSGGLGNQLFQFGAALRLARGDTNLIRFVVDKLTPSVGYRLPDLLGEIILPDIAAQGEANRVLQNHSAKQNVKVIRDTELGVFTDQNALDSGYQPEFDFAIIDGYLQSSRNALALRAFLIKNIEKIGLFREVERIPPEKIVAHYRLGDYLRIDVQHEIGIINPSYLDRAIDAADRSLSVERILLYSDDNMLRDMYGGQQNVECTIGGSDIEVFKKMVSATRLIITNSTYSLMAAYLSQHAKIVYRPLYWTRNTISDDLTSPSSPFEVVKIENAFLKI